MPLPFEPTLLSAADAPAVCQLHDAALSALNQPDWVRPEHPDFFQPVLEEGLSYGLFDGAQLIGYALMQTRLEPGDTPSGLPGLPDLDFAKLCGCSVAPAWRGRGLQERLSRHRLARARQLGWRAFFATAAPANHASWINLLRAGMCIGALGTKYGTALRYTLLSTPGQPGPQIKALALDDLAGQADQLARGWRGMARQGGDLLFQPWLTA